MIKSQTTYLQCEQLFFLIKAFKTQSDPKQQQKEYFLNNYFDKS